MPRNLTDTAASSILPDPPCNRKEKNKKQPVDFQRIHVTIRVSKTPEEGRTVSKTTLFDSRIKKYAYREAAQLYGELGSSPAGLSPEQVERQREEIRLQLLRQPQ